MRLNKYIAQAGLASRRKADDLIREGQVKVNGKIVTALGTLIDPETDNVRVGRKAIKASTQFVYYMLNKPISVLSSMSDPEERPTVADYFGGIKERVFPVGRLDWDSEGLILLTNDGTFSHSVAHPSKKIVKSYLVKIDGQLTQEKIAKLKRGVTIPGGKVKAIDVKIIKKGGEKYDWVKIAIDEGKNRQVRHMLAKVGYDVKKLQRVAIGGLTLGSLARGQIKKLKSSDLIKIFEPYRQKKTAEATIKKKKVVKKKKPKIKKVPKKADKKQFFKDVSSKSKS